jgi:lipoprotein-anchoring transpeptidase ErfK/SrfK
MTKMIKRFAFVVTMIVVATLVSASKPVDGDSVKAEYIVISKENFTLDVFDSEDRLICSFGVAVGKNYGNKQREGDMKTPEGEFYIEQIQPASHWGHDFKDGKGYIPNCYGNWFMRLKTPPHRGIGIHGTHAPESIGTRATEGCIRLKNSDLDSLYKMVRVGTKVTILPSLMDQRADGIVE